MILELSTPRHVCWRPHECQPYESVWSLLHKFCRWNRALHHDAWDLFAAPEKRFVPGHPARLFSRGMIDRRRMANALGLSLDQVNDGFPDRFLAQGRYSVEDRLSTSMVRMCPACIAGGYHSVLHDILFLPRCPVHGEALQETCPRCTQPVRKSLPTANNDATFACSCGHILWQSDRVHRMAEDELDRLQQTAAWLLHVKREALVPLYRFAGCESESPVFSHHIGCLSEFLGQVDESLRPPSFLVSPERRKARHAVRTLRTTKAAPTMSDRDLVSVYKAIARRLTRRVRRKLKNRYPHAGTFALVLHEQIQADPDNIVLYAWRAYWEGVAWYDWNAIFTNSLAGRNRWRGTVLARFVELVGKRPDSDKLGLSDLHFLASACLATLQECTERVGEALSLRDAGKLAAQITGEHVPLGMEKADAHGDRLIHLWLPRTTDELTILR